MDRTFRQLLSQKTARANAAEAASKLLERRHEREEVDAYLRELPSPSPAVTR